MDKMTMELQRQITRDALTIIGDVGFALAGSGAIREHGITNRLTEDIDMFASPDSETCFPRACDALMDGLVERGYEVALYRRSSSFMSLGVTIEGVTQQLDVGIDYRGHEPVLMPIGPVLDVRDAVANKVCAAFSRGELRDYIDLGSIRASGLYSDSELIDMAMDSDPGFDQKLFAESLQHFVSDGPPVAKRYGVDAQGMTSLKRSLAGWADRINGITPPHVYGTEMLKKALSGLESPKAAERKSMKP